MARGVWIRSLAAVTALSVVPVLSSAPAAAWEPSKPIEFVIQTSPGGGSDKYARLWIGIIEKHKLSPQPIIPVNKPGGGGAVALAFLHSKKGDPHFITPTLNSVVARPLLQKIPVMYPSEDLTPIAMLMTDPFFLWVHPDNFKSWEDFHKACKERRLTAVGTGSKQEDEIQILALQHAAGCQPFRYVPAKGGGDVAAGVAGKHQDFNVNQPSEALPHYPDKLIPILAFQKERAAAFKEAPSHHDKGFSADWVDLLDLDKGLHQMRGIVGPPDLPKDAVDWYVNLFQKVFETPEWQAFMKKGAMVPKFLNAEQYKAFLINFEKGHVKVMKDVLGWQMRDDLRSR